MKRSKTNTDPYQNLHGTTNETNTTKDVVNVVLCYMDYVSDDIVIGSLRFRTYTYTDTYNVLGHVIIHWNL